MATQENTTQDQIEQETASNQDEKEKPSGRLMLPAFDVDMLVDGGLIFHFQKLKTLEWLFEMWAQDPGILPGCDSDIYDGAAAIIRDTYEAYIECRRGIQELWDKARGDRPKPSPEEIMKALSEKEDAEPEGKRDNRRTDKKETILGDCLFELGDAEIRLTQFNFEIADPEIAHILLCIRITREKLDYYQAKYDFNVPNDDVHYFEDIIDFVKKRDRETATEAQEAT